MLRKSEQFLFNCQDILWILDIFIEHSWQWEVIVHFVDIVGIVDYHWLNSIFIMKNGEFPSTWLSYIKEMDWNVKIIQNCL